MSAESDAELRAALAEALDELEKSQGPEGVPVAPRHQLASLLQSYLVEHPGGLALRDTQPIEGGALEVMYDEGDIVGWARSLFAWWRGIVDEPWVDPPKEPEVVGDGERLRVAVVGDCGTGL
jgi:hypothetical protein